MEGSYRLMQIPGKGIGMVSSKIIKAGTLIVEEEPLLSLNLSENGDLEGYFDKDACEFQCPSLTQTLSRLTDAELKIVFSLSDSWTKNGKKSSFGIIKTNSFISRSSVAVYPTISRINHSCRPNCVHYYVANGFAVRAIEDICPDQEITISYLSPVQRQQFDSTFNRQKILQDEFGFLCLCNVCVSGDDLDDSMRVKILEIEQVWSQLDVKDFQKALELAKQQYTLAKRLNMHAGILSYVAIHVIEAASLAMASDAKNDRDNVKELGSRTSKEARDFAIISYGEGSRESNLFDEILRIWSEDSSNKCLWKDLAVNIQDLIAQLKLYD